MAKPIGISTLLLIVVILLGLPAEIASSQDQTGPGVIGPQLILPLADLQGKKFEDLDADGIWQVGEPPLAGVEITLAGTDVSGNYVSATDVTDASGVFSFSELMPGDYTVTETTWPSGEWMPSTPVSSGPHTLASGESLDLSWVFGNYRYASKAGHKMNTVLQTPLAGWTVELWDVSGSPFVVSTTSTNYDGAYRFDDIMPGSTYAVCELLNLGYEQDFPTANTTPPDDELLYDCTQLGPEYGPYGYQFSTESGDEYLSNDFGNSEPQGCTLGKGYWKTHSRYGPAAPEDPGWYTPYGPFPPDTSGPDAALFDSGYSWYQVFNRPVRGGNAWFILAHQWMAAYLNAYNFASTTGTDVISWLSEGASMLDAYDQYDDNKPLIPKGTADRNRAVELAKLLELYNEGYIGPGQCD